MAGLHRRLAIRVDAGEADAGGKQAAAEVPPTGTTAPAEQGGALAAIQVSHGWLVKEGDRWQVKTKPVEVQGYQEELAPGVAITMLRIPAGTFQMGSPAQEQQRRDHEGPQHEVKLREFFLGQTPISQAQWQEVAGWEKVERDLDPDPSRFQGPNRPVERVSWHAAVEFCRRLSRRTGKRYGLPSEAQWEYACRAGTTTPFYCGETLTAELANYDASSTYGDGPKGTYRRQTTDVGSFPANAWGLQDMHGTVREWCEDHWHGGMQAASGWSQGWDGVDRPGGLGRRSKAAARRFVGQLPRELPLGLPQLLPPRLRQQPLRFPRLLPPPGLILYT